MCLPYFYLLPIKILLILFWLFCSFNSNLRSHNLNENSLFVYDAKTKKKKGVPCSDSHFSRLYSIQRLTKRIRNNKLHELRLIRGFYLYAMIQTNEFALLDWLYLDWLYLCGILRKKKRKEFTKNEIKKNRLFNRVRSNWMYEIYMMYGVYIMARKRLSFLDVSKKKIRIRWNPRYNTNN